MDNERAKLILSAYRTGGADASDPVFAEALAQVQHDPELARWFAQEQLLDQRMHAALQAVRPPANLKESLLLAEKVARFPMPRAWWRRPAWLAVAAAVVLFAGLFLFSERTETPPKMRVAAVTSEIGRLQREARISLGVMTSDSDQIRNWLKEHDAPHEFKVPAALAGQTGLGCQVLNIQGNNVSLVCFRAGGATVHLLVMDRSRLVAPPAIGKPVFLQDGELGFATWSEGDRTYVLASHGNAESLRKWL